MQIPKKNYNKILNGEIDCLTLGNLKHQRDWGHTKDYADEDTINILKTQYKKGKFKGVLHCVSATQELAMEALDIRILYICIRNN